VIYSVYITELVFPNFEVQSYWVWVTKCYELCNEVDWTGVSDS